MYEIYSQLILIEFDKGFLIVCIILYISTTISKFLLKDIPKKVWKKLNKPPINNKTVENIIKNFLLKEIIAATIIDSPILQIITAAFKA